MIRTILAAALLAAASAAGAATAEDAEDMRCLIVAAELAEDDDSEAAEAGTIMTMYFLGRIDGRSPGANLEEILVREALEMSEADKQRLLISCSTQLEVRGKQMEALGSRLGG
jgi:NaMN:DMB phosphoribosyltransferase